MTDPLIRPEEPGDESGIRSVVEAAFERPAEADLIDRLRRRPVPKISLAAHVQGTIVGHVLFTLVSLTGDPDARWVGLGPLAVRPDFQRRGVGSALIRAGLDECRSAGYDAVVVVGHPAYYSRFGFTTASRFAITCRYDVPDEAFMLLELDAGRLRGRSGAVEYDPAFNEV